jgi:hypothetical protein
MALQTIDIGQAANDGTGDPLRAAFEKINDNFQQHAVALEDKLDANRAGAPNGLAQLDGAGRLALGQMPDNPNAYGAARAEDLDNVFQIATEMVPLSQRAQPGGVATLDGAGKVPAAQLPASATPADIAALQALMPPVGALIPMHRAMPLMVPLGTARWLRTGVIAPAASFPGVPSITLQLGEAWTRETLPSTDYRGVCAGGPAGDVYLAVGLNSAARRAADGSWVPLAMPNGAWHAVAWGAGRFVAAANGNTQLAVSSDLGDTWSLITPPGGGYPVEVWFGGGLFILITHTTTVYWTSADGLTWVQRALPQALSWRRGLYANGRHVIVSANGDKLLHSANGTSWTVATLPATSGYQSAAFGAGLWVVVPDGGDAVYTSADLASWTARYPMYDSTRRIAFRDGLFVIMGSSYVCTSSNGINWTAWTHPRQGGAAIDWLCGGPAGFVATSAAERDVLRSLPGGQYTATRTARYPVVPDSWGVLADTDFPFYMRVA